MLRKPRQEGRAGPVDGAGERRAEGRKGVKAFFTALFSLSLSLTLSLSFSLFVGCGVERAESDSKQSYAVPHRRAFFSSLFAPLPSFFGTIFSWRLHCDDPCGGVTREGARESQISGRSETVTQVFFLFLTMTLPLTNDLSRFTATIGDINTEWSVDRSVSNHRITPKPTTQFPPNGSSALFGNGCWWKTLTLSSSRCAEESAEVGPHSSSSVLAAAGDAPYRPRIDRANVSHSYANTVPFRF